MTYGKCCQLKSFIKTYNFIKSIFTYHPHEKFIDFQIRAAKHLSTPVWKWQLYNKADMSIWASSGTQSMSVHTPHAHTNLYMNRMKHQSFSLYPETGPVLKAPVASLPAGIVMLCRKMLAVQSRERPPGCTRSSHLGPPGSSRPGASRRIKTLTRN